MPKELIKTVEFSRSVTIAGLDALIFSLPAFCEAILVKIVAGFEVGYKYAWESGWWKAKIVKLAIAGNPSPLVNSLKGTHQHIWQSIIRCKSFYGKLEAVNR